MGATLGFIGLGRMGGPMAGRLVAAGHRVIGYDRAGAGGRLPDKAVVFGARLGLDLGQMIDVINVSSGRTTASSDKFPRSVIPRSYDFGFAGALMAKDAALYDENAEAAGVPHDLAAAVSGLWQEFDRAHPGADFTAIHKYLEDKSHY